MLEYKTMSMCASSDYCRGWNDAMVEMPKWISVKDRTPEYDRLVLVFCKVILSDHTFCAQAIGCCHNPKLTDDADCDEDWTVRGINVPCRQLLVTHWMPLPDAPKDTTMVFSKKKWMECPLPDDIRKDALQSGWVDECDGKPVENGQCGQLLIVDTWCVYADEWEAYDDE